jgi:hypothetical protein
MDGRTIWRALAVVLLVAVTLGIGAALYNAGLTAGIAEGARQAAASGDPVAFPYGYGYGPYFHGPFGGGFGFFGLIAWILVFFLAIGLVRAAFGRGRHGGGPGRGHGGWGGRGEMAEDWHRDLHRREAGEPEQRPSGA